MISYPNQTDPFCIISSIDAEEVYSRRDMKESLYRFINSWSSDEELIRHFTNIFGCLRITEIESGEILYQKEKA